MSAYLDVECPACRAPAGMFCTDFGGNPMILGHAARKFAATAPDGDLGPEDPDDTIVPLEGLVSAPVPAAVQRSTDTYQTLSVLRWAQRYEDIDYHYVAIKIEEHGWFLSGKETGAIPWDVLWNRHLTHALWIESATTWSTVKT